MMKKWKKTTLGRSEQLERTVSAAQDAVAATPLGHPDRAAHLWNLGSSLQARYDATGKVRDLDAVILAAGEAAANTPHDHPDRQKYLSNFDNSLRTRSERFGDFPDEFGVLATLRGS